MDPSAVRRLFGTPRRRRLASWAGAASVGVYLGYQIAVFGAGGGFGAFSAVTAGVLAIASVVALLVMAGASAAQPDRHGLPTARTQIVAAVLVAAGTVGTWAIMPVLRPELRPPVVLQAQGTVTLSLEGLVGYAASGEAPATCRSEPDGQEVASIESNGVGVFGPERVAASVSYGWSQSTIVSTGILIWIRADRVETMWQASEIEDTKTDHGGRLAFSVGNLISDGEPGRPSEGWPAEVSGTLSWSCGEWD